MSKLLEYAALIPKGLPNSLHIIEAIVNEVKLKYDVLPEEEKEEIVKRRVICNTCPFNSENSPISEEYHQLTNTHYKTRRKDKHCSFCGCEINLRTSALKKNCGAEVWNDNNPEHKIELRWKMI